MMTHRTILQLVAITSLVATVGYAYDPNASDRGNGDAPTTPVADRTGANSLELDGANRRQMRLREGMKLVNQVGEFRETGGRITFYPDGETHSLPLLENLALERVSQDLDQTHRKWSVTGMITEYGGRNYLFLHRAVLKARISSAPGQRS